MKNLIQLHVPILLLIFCLDLLAQQKELSYCREVLDLLKQKDLSLSAGLVNPVVVRGEVLEPILQLRNRGTSVISVPKLNPLEIVARSMTRSDEKPGSGHSFHFTSIADKVHTMPDRTYQGCSFQVMQLFPGETYEIVVPVIEKSPWQAAGGENAYSTMIGQYGLGQGRFEMELGPIIIYGDYQTVLSETIQLSYLRHESESPSAPDPRLVRITVVQIGQKFLLMSEPRSESQSDHKITVRPNRIGNSATLDFVLAMAGRVRIAEFDELPTLQTDTSTNAETFESLSVQSKGGAASLNELWTRKMKTRRGGPQ